MRIRLMAVGRLKRGPERDLVERYLTRAKPLARGLGVSDVDETEMSDPAPESLAAISGDVIALDERGDDVTSAELAELLEAARNEARDVAFLIGGPDGLGDAVLAAAHRRIRFGACTWPHDLVRAMAAEQIYRALSILARHPYHRP